jgi:hypothetical protein
LLYIESADRYCCQDNGYPTDENVHQDFAINLFPNPAGDQLNVLVEGVDKNAEIKVYNLVGKISNAAAK